MRLVIGSGPSGVACASALIAEGHRVTLVDGGQRLEPARALRKEAMAAREPADWTAEDVAAARTPVTSQGEVGHKLCQGSDYPYRSAPGAAETDHGGLFIRGSYAQAGLSSVWGSALMPFRQEDMDGWPVTAQELAEAHAAILRLMPYAAEHDDLEALFPLYAGPTDHARQSRQIQRLMTAMRHNRAPLRKAGIHFGASRLAVRFAGHTNDRPCNYCGACLNGCPRDLIYSSAQSLPRLLETGKLTYLSGITVREIVEGGEQVTVSGLNGDGAPWRIDAARVFLAAGALNSTEILARSLGWHGRAIEIADSQYYVFPLLQFAATSNVVAEPLHTLAQAFVEIFDEKISPYAIHLQIYSYNDLLRDILRAKLGGAARLLPENVILGRMLLVQGYLHSAHSGAITLTLEKRGDADRVTLRGVARADTQMRVARVLGKLSRAAPALGAYPIKALLQVTEPGRGFHIGGSFPMSANPRVGQTDRLGRPYGWKRTHVVDATVLPSICAPTITQTVMANAYRIGREAAKFSGASS